MISLAVAPFPAAASTADPVATQIDVVQTEPWSPGGDHLLDVTVTAESGAIVDAGRVIVEVEGVWAGSSRVPTGSLSAAEAPLEPGEYEALVRYSPAAGYAGAVWTGSVTVVDGTVPTEISVSAPSGVEYQDTELIEVEVSAEAATPEGKIGVYWGDSTTPSPHELVDGRASFPTVHGQLGDVVGYEVVYFSRGGMQSSRTSGSYTIDRLERELEIWDDTNQDGVLQVARQPWEVAVYVPDLRSGLRDGTMSLYVDGELLESRSFPNPGADYIVTTFELGSAELAVGRHRLRAELTDATYIQDTSTSWTVDVKKNATKIYVGHGAGRKLRWGQKHKVSMVAEPVRRIDADPDMTGSITVRKGSTTFRRLVVDGRGHASMSIGGKSLPLGRHTFHYAYPGDTYYGASSATRTPRVYKARSQLRATLVDRIVDRPQVAKVKIRVTSPSNVGLTGRLKVKVDGRVVKTPWLWRSDHGRKTVTLPKLDYGDYKVRVVYAGKSKVAPSGDNTVELHVN